MPRQMPLWAVFMLGAVAGCGAPTLTLTGKIHDQEVHGTYEWAPCGGRAKQYCDKAYDRILVASRLHPNAVERADAMVDAKRDLGIALGEFNLYNSSYKAARDKLNPDEKRWAADAYYDMSLALLIPDRVKIVDPCLPEDSVLQSAELAAQLDPNSRNQRRLAEIREACAK